MTNARAPRPAALLTLVLFLAGGLAVPVHHHADHDGDGTHLTAGDHDHAHGSTLVVRDMRTERPGVTLDVPVTSAVTTLPEPGVTDRRTASRAPSVPRGRSPPSPCRPRAPPLSS